MTTLRSFVGGSWRDAGRPTHDVNPARPSEAVADVLQAPSEVAADAVDAAQAAFANWRATPAPARGEAPPLLGAPPPRPGGGPLPEPPRGPLPVRPPRAGGRRLGHHTLELPD